MEKLEIYQVYKFKKGGSEFYISEGQNIKVKVKSEYIYEGVLTQVGAWSEFFDIETNEGVITIDCEDVIDIMPV